MLGSGVFLRGKVVISKINKVVFLCNCMGKIKEMDGDVEEIKDVKDVEEEELEEVEGNIFDEDVESEVSDFDIGSTMLVTAPAVESWAGQNLEEKISREHVEKDWGDDEKFADGGVYKPAESSSDVYSAGGSDVYGKGGSDVYGASGNDVYNSSGSGGAYDSAKSDGGYSAGPGNSGGMKSYDQLKDDRRGSRSMLEIAGFEDKDKGKERVLRDDLRRMENTEG